MLKGKIEKKIKKTSIKLGYLANFATIDTILR
jgi:hypothetical protein